MSAMNRHPNEAKQSRQTPVAPTRHELPRLRSKRRFVYELAEYRRQSLQHLDGFKPSRSLTNSRCKSAGDRDRKRYYIESATKPHQRTVEEQKETALYGFGSTTASRASF